MDQHTERSYIVKYSHYKFINYQIKDLITHYLKKEIERKYIQKFQVLIKQDSLL